MTQSVWWSWAQSTTGRSPVTASSASRVGGPSGHSSSSHPCPCTHPSPSAWPTIRNASAIEAAPPRSSSVRASAQSRKWTWASQKAGQHAAPLEIDALVAHRVGAALAHVDTPRDRVAGDGEGPHLREARIHRVDGPVVEITAPLTYATVTPRDEIDRRLAALRSALAADGLDGALIVQHTDLAYFSGTNQQAHLVVPGRRRARAPRAARARAGTSRVAPRADRARPAIARGARGRDGVGPGLENGSTVGLELDVLPAAALPRPIARRLPDHELDDCSPRGPPGARPASPTGSWHACAPPPSRCGAGRKRFQR